MLTLLDPALDPARVRLIAYDLDGTLVDAFEDIWMGVGEALRAAGLAPLPYATVRSYVGDGAAMLIRRCLGGAHQDLFEEVYGFYRNYYAAHPVDRAHLYPGVLETLDALRAKGLRQAILTNKPDEVTRQVCERLGLAGRVDGIWGERPGHPCKPDARALHEILEYFAVEPDECLFVGDGPADAAVTAACAVHLAAVSYGLLGRSQLETVRPAVILDAIAELLTIFLTPPPKPAGSV